MQRDLQHGSLVTFPKEENLGNKCVTNIDSMKLIVDHSEPSPGRSPVLGVCLNPPHPPPPRRNCLYDTYVYIFRPKFSNNKLFDPIFSNVNKNEKTSPKFDKYPHPPTPHTTACYRLLPLLLLLLPLFFLLLPPPLLTTAAAAAAVCRWRTNHVRRFDDQVSRATVSGLEELSGTRSGGSTR